MTSNCAIFSTIQKKTNGIYNQIPLSMLRSLTVRPSSYFLDFEDSFILDEEEEPPGWWDYFFFSWRLVYRRNGELHY